MSYKATLFGAAASFALLASAVAPAGAAHFNGWYVGLEGGASWVEDNKYDFGTSPTPNPALTSFNNGAQFDTGWAVLATVGYGFGSNFRAEFEAGWRQNDVSLFIGALQVPFRGATLDELSLMANILYDIPIGSKFMLTFGAGAGGDDAKLNDGVIDDDDWRFAYQGIVGLSYALGSRMDLSLTYRYLRASGPDYTAQHQTVLTHFDRESYDDLVKHTLTIGLRYDLWPDAVDEPMAAVEAPPPPPAAAMPAQSFMIFFGFNKCNITPEADNVLGQAAEAAHQMGSVAVQIVGHTDTVGSNKYNQKLSECRAHAAKSTLVGKGVPEAAIATSGKGETELLVQTADGVKEPQNRRATIDLQ